MIQEFTSDQKEFPRALSDINRQLGLAMSEMRNADRRIKGVKAFLVKGVSLNGKLRVKYDLQKETKYDLA